MLQMYSKNQKLSVDELQMLADQARRVLPKRVAYFASVLGLPMDELPFAIREADGEVVPVKEI